MVFVLVSRRVGRYRWVVAGEGLARAPGVLFSQVSAPWASACRAATASGGGEAVAGRI